MPGSPIYNDPLKYGYTLDYNHIQKYNLSPIAMTENAMDSIQQLEAYKKRLYMKQYFNQLRKQGHIETVINFDDYASACICVY